MISVDETLQNMEVWILSDGKVGHVNQSLGIAESLDISPEIIELKEKPYGKILGRINGSMAVENKFAEPWPDMVIATGTLPALVSGWIKQQNPKTITVQMMTPPSKHYLYDIIATPLHDSIRKRNNIIHTIGSPNRITPQVLQEAKKKWKHEFLKMDNPLAILIGGSNKYFTFNEEYAEKFAKDTIKFAEKHGFKSLLVTSSRRTGEEQIKIIEDIFAKSKLTIYFWNGEGENPYSGYLSWAKAVLVTADSIGMISESCTVGLPICVYGIEHMKSKKFSRFFKAVNAQKMLTKFSLNAGEFNAPANPLSDTKMVSGAVQAIILKRNFVG